jgi:hypothetical protein
MQLQHGFSHLKQEISQVVEVTLVVKMEIHKLEQQITTQMQNGF